MYLVEVKRTEATFNSLAFSTAFKILWLFPEVVNAISTSPSRAKPSSWRENTNSKPKSFDMAVKIEVSVVNAIDEIASALQSGIVKDDDRWYTVKWMTANNIGDAQ